MANIPFFIATGFLGSGKTTLLKRFLEEHAEQKRIAIIQNEFAESNIDSRDLKSIDKPFEILEINRGSVFCVCLLSDFVSSCAALVDRVKPDAVILEASGLADPIAIAQILQAPELQERVSLRYLWCIADAAHFLQMEKTITRIGHQIRVADEVLVNKIDLVNDEVLEAIKERIVTLNPLAKISEVSYCDTDIANVFLPVTGEDPIALQRAREHSSLPSSKRPPIHSAAIRTHTRISRQKLDAFLSTVASDCYRCKGFVNLREGGVVSVQVSFETKRIEMVATYQGPTELIALGPAIDPKA
jgi:G3E family GTPase